MTTIFNDVRILTSLLDSNDDNPAIHWARNFIEKRESVEHRLVAFNHDSNRWTDRGRLDECCRLALILYMNTVARRLWSIAPVIVNMTVELRTALLDLGPIAGDVELRDLLFWTLFTGARMSTGLTREWFMAKLKELSSVMNIVLWTDCKRLLKQIVWYGTTFEFQCQSFWLQLLDSDVSSGYEE
jgi:hypothetical protein